MDRIRSRYTWLFFAILLSILAGAYLLYVYSPSQSGPPLKPANEKEAAEAVYVTVKDTAGKTILQTGTPVAVDDEYINENNVHYVIIKIDGTNAVAKIKPDSDDSPAEASVSESSPETAGIFGPDDTAKPHVVIYHTHSDESYAGNTGITSKPGKGDIFKVGSALTDSLKKSGVTVTHSFARHDPHDVNAYHRSRRTALKLLKERPDAAFDIHRDSAPINAYFTTVNGVNAARVMIVVGRSNPHLRTNLSFAKKIKATGDKLYPGMMRGIFIGHGDYNQDLYPTALIFEIGAEDMTLGLAENAATCLGDVISHVMKR